MKTEIPETAKKYLRTGRPDRAFEPLEDGWFLAIEPKGARRWSLHRVEDETQNYQANVHVISTSTKKRTLRVYRLHRALAKFKADEATAREENDAIAREEWADICREHTHPRDRAFALRMFTPLRPSWFEEEEPSK